MKTRILTALTLLGRAALLRGLGSAFLLLLVARAALPVAGFAQSWVTNGPLNTARYNHTATLLPNGQGIVSGTVTRSKAYVPSSS
jgi:hypothetical protein